MPWRVRLNDLLGVALRLARALLSQHRLNRVDLCGVNRERTCLGDLRHSKFRQADYSARHKLCRVWSKVAKGKLVLEIEVVETFMEVVVFDKCRGKLSDAKRRAYRHRG